MIDAAAAARRARFDAALARLPLVAILRGLPPADAEPLARALYDAGFRVIEVPLNSPQPFDSIARIRRVLADDAIVGAGTVLAPDAIERLHAAGGDLVVMPHADGTLIRAAKAAGLLCTPGVATPTEAFGALQAGADALKLFPAELLSPAVLKAMKAVLPAGTRLWPVGGITPQHLAPYRDAGATGVGLGSALYPPGAPVADVAARARAFVDAWAALSAPPRNAAA
jgi:2-dehydro-3-deoxyphosphogalactonate aldolase